MSLVNVPDWPLIGERSQFQRHIASVERMRKLYPEAYRHCSTFDMLALRELLSKAWASPDLPSREWYLCALRHLHAETLRGVQALRGDGEKKLVRDWQDKKAQLDFILKKPETAGAALYSMLTSERFIAALKNGPPSDSFFDDCVLYLQRNVQRASVCRLNKGDLETKNGEPIYCKVTPYFFRGIGKKQQPYCSQECARIGLLAGKRTWWNKNRAKAKRR